MALIVSVNFRKTSGVTSQWLIGRFDNLDPHAGPGTVETYARVCLWHFLGTFLFPDTSGNVVSWIFLDILRRPWENIALFSWGSAVLAWMYRQLCAACRHGSGYPSLGGCSYLLQIWIWYRWPVGRPRMANLPVSNLRRN
jgi:hypothetical protein